MRGSSPAILVSLILHAVAAGLILFSWPQRHLPPNIASVPVTIVSSALVVAAAPPDNPVETPVTETPEPPTPEPEPPAPAPPPPQPRPAPTPPRPEPAERPATRPQPQPKTEQPRPTPPARQPEPSWDPSSVASGGSSSRDRNRQPARPATPAAPSGQQGQGEAPRAIGRGDLQALGRQVVPIFNCDLPGAADVTVRVAVTLSDEGRIIGSPRLVRPASDAAYRAVSDSVIRAVRAAAPFDMPSGYSQQELTFAFVASNYCS